MNGFRRFSRKALLLPRFVRARWRGRPAPLIVGLSITARCNLRCSFCFGRYYEQKVEDISLSDLLGLIENLADAGCLHINYSGGEPLLRKDIPDILRFTVDRGIITAVSTNGILVDRYLDVLKEIDFVSVSLDGDEASHDRVRGAGTYRKTMDNILLLRKEKVPVQVACLLNRYNGDSIRGLLELGKKHNFAVKMLIPNEETELGPTNPDVDLSDEEIREAISRIISWQREGFPVFFSSETYRQALTWPKSHWEPIAYAGEDIKEPWPCYAGRYWCQIDADGKVYPCCAMIKNFAALDFREVGFDRAFRHAATRPCRSCAYLSNNEFNQLIGLRYRSILENIWRTVKWS